MGMGRSLSANGTATQARHRAESIEHCREGCWSAAGAIPGAQNCEIFENLWEIEGFGRVDDVPLRKIGGGDGRTWNPYHRIGSN
jgi:hypothetical protein